MKNGLTYSGLLHLAIFAFIAIGLPELRDPTPMIAQPIPVEVVTIAKKSNPPPGRKRVVKDEPKPKAEAPQARKPAPSPPKPEPKPQKKPDPPKKPNKELAVVPPAPKPPPKPQPKKPEPKPKPIKPRVTDKPTLKPQPKPKRTTPRVAAKPDLKPEPKKAKPKQKAKLDFNSVLKSVNKMRPKRRQSDRDLAARVERKGAPDNRPSQPLSMSEMDAVRRQIGQCWNVPAGAKDADKLLVEVKVWMRPNRTVRKAQIVDRSRMRRDNFYRVAAESALRAVLNPKCSPLKLPPDKFDTWKTFTVVFDPKDMIGG